MTFHRPHMLTKVRSERLTQAIKGMPCTLRIASFVPGHGCAGQDTVVGAHLPIWGRGTSTKATDLAVVAACLNCHDILDGRPNSCLRDWIDENYPRAIPERIFQGLTETHALLLDRGIITVEGMELI